MGIISKPYTFSPNTTASSSEVNANYDTIYNEFNGNIAAANLATSAVTTAKVADAAITTAKIADGNVTTDKINNKAVTTAKIDDGAITPDKRSGGVAYGTITLSATGNLSVTGLDFQPKEVEFTWNPGDNIVTAAIAVGGMNENGSQFYAWSSAQSGNFSRNSGTDACLANGAPGSSTNTNRAVYVSMNSDGFTINVTAQTGQTYIYRARG